MLVDGEFGTATVDLECEAVGVATFLETLPLLVFTFDCAAALAAARGVALLATTDVVFVLVEAIVWALGVPAPFLTFVGADFGVDALVVAGFVVVDTPGCFFGVVVEGTEKADTGILPPMGVKRSCCCDGRTGTGCITGDWVRLPPVGRLPLVAKVAMVDEGEAVR